MLDVGSAANVCRVLSLFHTQHQHRKTMATGRNHYPSRFADSIEWCGSRIPVEFKNYLDLVSYERVLGNKIPELFEFQYSVPKSPNSNQCQFIS